MFVYARGGDHPHRSPSRAVLEAARDGRIDATTSAEVVQEILHVCGRERTRRPAGLAIAREILEAFDPVLSIDARDVHAAVELWQGTPDVDARDALHGAVCLRHGLDLISTDRAFDRIPGIRRFDPGRVPM